MSLDVRQIRAVLCVVAMASLTACTTFNGPLEVSDNGRHLVWADGAPFYYVADTPWQLLASLDLPDTKEYIDIRADQGFTAVQLVATPWSFDDRAARWDFEGEQGQARVNANGDVPFFNAQGQAPRNNDEVRFDRPNDAYWRHVDQVLDHLATKDMAAYFIPLWASNFSRSFSEDAHYAIGKTLGTRYRAQTNLVWVLGGDEARVSVAKYRALHRGLRDAGITQLVTMHPRSGRSSAAHLLEELDFNSVQDRGSVSNMLKRIRADYRRTPVKPTFLCETWYEHDKNGGVFRIHKVGTSPVFRAHYWAARLNGGFGEGYGGWTIWLNLETWRDDIRRPGAVAIATHMRDILETVAWQDLEPDAHHVALGAHDRVHTAIAPASKTAVAYFEAPIRVWFDPRWFAGDAELTWYDPATGAVAGTANAREPTCVKPPTSGDAVLVMRPR